MPPDPHQDDNSDDLLDDSTDSQFDTLDLQGDLPEGTLQADDVPVIEAEAPQSDETDPLAPAEETVVNADAADAAESDAPSDADASDDDATADDTATPPDETTPHRRRQPAAKRISRLTASLHSERDRAAAAEAQATELQQQLADAQAALEQERVGHRKQTQTVYESRTEDLKRRLETATENADYAEMANAAADLAKVQAQVAQIEATPEPPQPAPAQTPTREAPQPRAPAPTQQQQISQAAQHWIDNNSDWLNQPGYEDVTQFAAAQEQLLMKTFAPQSAELYDALNAKLQQELPDMFDEQPTPQRQPAARRAPAQTVAAPGRAAGAQRAAPKAGKFDALDRHAMQQMGMDPNNGNDRKNYLDNRGRP